MKGFGIMKTYSRAPLRVEAIEYSPGKGIEDGFELWTKVITNGWINNDNLIQIEREDGQLVCPFIENKRGRIFIRKGDYIIFEADNEKHVCGADKFELRYQPLD